MSFQLNAADHVRLKVYCYRSPQVALNILGYRVSSQGGAGITLVDFLTFMDTLLQPVYQAAMIDTATYYGVTAQAYRSTLGWSIVETRNANAGAGTVNGDPLPMQTCGLITKINTKAGRKNRGRIYVPFPGEADSTVNGVPSAGYVLKLRDIGNILCVDQLVAVGADNCLMTPVLGNLETGPLADVSAHVDRTKWATQRRRGEYGRPNVIPPF